MDALEKIFNIEGKIIVIVGATGILGTQYVDVLCACKAKVIIGDYIIGKCEKMAEEMRNKYNADVLSLKIDITNEKDIVDFFEVINNHYGRFDVLINNAQIKTDGFYASFENLTKSTLMTVLDGNLAGVVLCCQEACKTFLKQGYGNIINISSTYGNVGADQRLYDGVKNIYYPDQPFCSPVTYAITKAGILNLTRYLASYFREKNIRVNTLTPGGVYDSHDENFIKNYSSRTLLGRMADKREYNGAILFLSSDASSYMTGSNLIVDGGWTAI
jgi:NAD(P)-dependent dehydrogenase (short-subunit alcohol dehydrogenase family)